MCRLYTHLSANRRAVATPLVAGDNSLLQQSREHPHGWGVAYWDSGAMGLARGTEPAFQSRAFGALCELLSAPVVLAHVRKASVGEVDLQNTHPFVRGRWAFAHNGTIQKFERRRTQVEQALARDLRPGLQGQTDSERCFLWFLSRLRTQRQGTPLERAWGAMSEVAQLVRLTDPPDKEKPSSVNFLVSEGSFVLGLRMGRELVYTTEKDSKGKVTSLMIASEPTHPDAEWCTLEDGQAVGMGPDMVVRLFHV